MAGASKLQILKKLPIGAFVAVSISVLLGGCGGGAVDVADSIKELKNYYLKSPPNTGWEIMTISAENEQKLIVDMRVISESDLNKIASVSRMQQFAIAKLGCPITSDDLRSKIGKDTEVWVRLNSSTEVLTFSICPH